MWKSGVVAVFAAAALSPCLAASPDAFQRGKDTIWEVLWHQSGTATRLVRWGTDIKVRMTGVNVAAHRQHTLQALRDVAGVAGVKVIDVTDEPDAASQANVKIEIVPDSALSEAQPCETRLDFKTETTIDSVTMQMRDTDARRCAYHESMHVMGVRGHPEGDTVLNYFTSRTEGLGPLDKVLLRAWYSPRVHPGATPFEVLPVLADELVAISHNRARAQKERDAFLADTVARMQAFAQGQGDVPKIIKDCGKTTENGVRYGRLEMSYFLGVAYQNGASVKQDAGRALQWLQRAASLGDRDAKTQLAAAASVQEAGAASEQAAGAGR
jgi:hypothetical protein